MLTNLFAVQNSNAFITSRLLRSLNVQVTGTTIRNTLLDHPDYPSLLSISDALRAWQVNNVAASIPKEQLTQLPLPFIAHTYAGGSENFTLVTAVGEAGVRYFHGDKEMLQSTEAFSKAWSGVALLAEKGETSGETNYAANRRNERLAAVKLPAALLLGLFIIVFATFSFYKRATTVDAAGYGVLLLLKLAGMVVTGLLLWYETDKAAPALQKICTAGAKTNCNAILTSKQSKLFSWLSWSEVGFFYFAATFISLLLAGFTSPAFLLPLVVLLNIAALPYTVFSLYYQWRVAKQWCVLCLSVQALLVLEFITSLGTGFLPSSFASLLTISSFSHAISSFFP